jgi:TRAP-type C4-dicarboxylate transport system permease small subunit
MEQGLQSEFAAGVAADAREQTLFGRLVDSLNALGSLLVFAMMLLILADIARRTLVSQPVYGVSEMIAMSVIILVFVQLASTLRHGRMARAEIFIDPFRRKSPRLGGLLQATFDLAGAFVCGVIAWFTFPLLIDAYQSAEYLGTVGLFTAPVWPMRLAIFIGATLTGLQYLLNAAANLRPPGASASSPLSR